MSTLFQKSESGPVECMGQTFPSDEERKEHYLKLLAEKLKDPAFRSQEGFPNGTDEDILALSDPPYYTACPNPFLGDFVHLYGKPHNSSTKYHKAPFAADVRDGRNDAIYNAHSYHTKVPSRAIVRFILNYTQPGDLVFDGFCGTGMTSVAAQLCGDRAVIEALGYRVDTDGTIWAKEADAGKATWIRFSKIGARRSIVSDLSPAATFIAYSYNRYQAHGELENAVNPILQEVEGEFAWMFKTLHNPTAEVVKNAVQMIDKDGTPDLSRFGKSGRINYIVWSEVFSCPQCAADVVFWDVAVDRVHGKVRDKFKCPGCDLLLSKDDLESRIVNGRGADGSQTSHRLQVPAYIKYSVGKQRFEKSADAADKALAKRISELGTL